MIYLLSQTVSTYGLLTYREDNELARDMFSQGMRVSATSHALVYEARSRSALAKARTQAMIDVANGPMLINKELKAIIELIAPASVQFFDAIVRFEEQVIDSFSSANVLERLECVDMSKSEYEQTNFDPSNPHYFFTYTVLRDDLGSGVDVCLSLEQSNQIVVSERVKRACVQSGLRNLKFCRAIDLSHGDRSDCMSL